MSRKKEKAFIFFFSRKAREQQEEARSFAPSSLLARFAPLKGMESSDEEPPLRASIGFLLLRLVLERDRKAVAADAADAHAASPLPTPEPLPAPLDTPHLFLTLDGRRTVLESDDG